MLMQICCAASKIAQTSVVISLSVVQRDLSMLARTSDRSVAQSDREIAEIR